MTEMFWTGVLFGASMVLLLLIIGLAVYVRVWGAFTIGPPAQRPSERS